MVIFRSEQFSKNTEIIYGHKVPFIVGTTTGNDGWWKNQNSQLKLLNFDADEYTHTDNIHFSTKSHRELGKLYYDEFLKIFS